MRAREKRVAAVLLAAGGSRRAAPVNKLLAEIGGVPLVARAADAALASRACPVLVVTGHQAGALCGALGERELRFVHNPEHAAGMGRSLAVGIAAIADEVEGALVCLADMPDVRAEHLDALIEAFDPEAGRMLVAPVHAGRRGHPVLFGARYFPELRALEGDEGARRLLETHAESLCAVPVDDPGVLRDLDTTEDLEGACRP